MRDLATVMKTDRLRIQSLVLIAVFVILIVLLRIHSTALFVDQRPVQLLRDVGRHVSALLAIRPGDFAGLDWKVAIFLFTILIAVGEDYNIFLITAFTMKRKTADPSMPSSMAWSVPAPSSPTAGSSWREPSPRSWRARWRK